VAQDYQQAVRAFSVQTLQGAGKFTRCVDVHPDQFILPGLEPVYDVRIRYHTVYFSVIFRWHAEGGESDFHGFSLSPDGAVKKVDIPPAINYC
jgi:hypothetical protein